MKTGKKFMSNSKKEIYNSEPVLYCRNCLSLKIFNVKGMEDSDYCDECGSTAIEETSIEEWEELYKKKYGMKFLDKKY